MVPREELTEREEALALMLLHAFSLMVKHHGHFAAAEIALTTLASALSEPLGRTEPQVLDLAESMMGCVREHVIDAMSQRKAARSN